MLVYSFVYSLLKFTKSFLVIVTQALLKMGSHKSTLLHTYDSVSVFSFATTSRRHEREVTSTKLHAAMVRLFEHQNNMEQSQERYQDQFVHRDVDVITAGLSKTLGSILIQVT